GLLLDQPSETRVQGAWAPVARAAWQREARALTARSTAQGPYSVGALASRLDVASRELAPAVRATRPQATCRFASSSNCELYSLAYAPPSASSSSCVPRSTMRPS